MTYELAYAWKEESSIKKIDTADYIKVKKFLFYSPRPKKKDKGKI
jgi:hypothetical protein